VRRYDLKDDAGRVFAFEIDQPWGGRRRVCAILRRIPGAKLTRTPRFLSWFREESFCEFELASVRFEALEPYGDNSRYWIGPKDCRRHPEIEDLMRAFGPPGSSK
jgi:hypothetical protein